MVWGIWEWKSVVKQLLEPFHVLHDYQCSRQLKEPKPEAYASNVVQVPADGGRDVELASLWARVGKERT